MLHDRVLVLVFATILCTTAVTCIPQRQWTWSTPPPSPPADDDSVRSTHAHAPAPAPAHDNEPYPAYSDSFSLRQALHISIRNRSAPVLRLDYDGADLTALGLGGIETTHPVEALTTTTWRANSQAAFEAFRWAQYNAKRRRAMAVLATKEEYETQVLADTFGWDEVEIKAPNTSSVRTLQSLAKMANNAYVPFDSSNWWNLTKKWNIVSMDDAAERALSAPPPSMAPSSIFGDPNTSQWLTRHFSGQTDSFGWLEDGLRGHVFANPTNTTVVVALKGTSAAFIGGGGSTSKNDKINDNLLFSCCCARVDWSWSTVCDCYNGTYTCKQDCLEHAVMTKSAYYPVATDLFNNISAIYPHAQIWLTGHSLGGSLAAMLSRTYAVPSVSFEAPGDFLPARRLHLPIPPPKSGLRNADATKEITTHVYHTADPIPMGVCTGSLSTCGVAGFALESRCHTGESIVYDTVGRLGWSVDIRTHSIKPVIEKVLIPEWGVTEEQRKKEEEERKRKETCENRDGDKGDKEESVGARRQSVWSWGWWPLPGGGGKSHDKDRDECDQIPPEEPDDGQHFGRGVPDATREDDGECVDCFKWEFN
ncbi:BZ3500_MvSof-1268-A1-R1_Chr3-1g05688 [Microbotryum saponariae]|uniref:triacylglycerol lipase n=1 Tax=Microbotryum saponariae TaxID=289078 RepID=A0A2X0LIS8_9BASI|nr:BZ3500_MvSof-1268-A1-R1_Chr3-1g05688 [Microbotryum saponariae]SDA04878.1 BZ3501_MvSof-1269-A2-R1_Chr3-1g05358 [Microbotryum saponariae]